MSDTTPIGLIAGQGRLPVMVAQGIHAAGRPVACVGLRECYDPDMPDHCDTFAPAGIIQLNKWIRILRRAGATEAVMVGRVAKDRMYHPLRLVRQLPDWRMARLWYRRTRQDKRSATLLAAVADELATGGITLIDSTTYIPDHVARQGVMTQTHPSRAQLADIEFAWPIVTRLNELDIGQGVAVKEREIIAVEAMEGTNAMIDRAGSLCRAGGWLLIKIAKPDHDMRADVPTVGPVTIEKLRAAGATCLVVEADKTILIEKPRMLELADRYGIAVIGMTIEHLGALPQ